MIKKSLAIIPLLMLSLGVFTSCVNEPGEEDLQKELYVRSFIKEFGLYDMNHNWCTSFPAEINLDEYAENINIYAERNGEYRLVASYVNPTDSKLKFEIPENCTELIVDIDGNKYIASPGDAVSRGGVVSRADGSEPVPSSRAENIKLVNKPYEYIYAAEDMGGVGDWDFNDIVFGISYICGNSPRAQVINVIPLAAGGTLETYLYFEDMKVSDEWHSLFNTPTGTMINTNAGCKVKLPQRYYQIPRPEGWTVNSEQNFKLKIMERGEMGTKTERWIQRKVIDDYNETMNIPQMLILPGDWKWPVERVKITKAYRNFKTWVNDYENTEWLHLLPTTSSLVINWNPTMFPQYTDF